MGGDLWVGGKNKGGSQPEQRTDREGRSDRLVMADNAAFAGLRGSPNACQHSHKQPPTPGDLVSCLQAHAIHAWLLLDFYLLSPSTSFLILAVMKRERERNPKMNHWNEWVMIIVSTLLRPQWWGQGDAKWRVESVKIRLATENKHVLASERRSAFIRLNYTICVF